MSGPKLDSNDGTVERVPVVEDPDKSLTISDDDPPASAFIEKDGIRYVRSEALKETRESLKKAKGQLKQATEKAAKYDLVEPYLGLIAEHPTMRAKAGKPPKDDPAPERKPSGPKLQETDKFDAAIESLGIDPDVGRKLVALVSHVAAQQIGETVGPVAEAAHKSSAHLARQRAYAAKDEQGNLYAKREFIDQVFNNLPPHLLANDSMIEQALVMARGLGGDGGSAVSEPLHMDGTGRRPAGGGEQPLTVREKDFAKRHEMSEEDYKKYSSLDSNVLE